MGHAIMTLDRIVSMVRNIAPVGLDPYARVECGALRRIQPIDIPGGLSAPWDVPKGHIVFVYPPSGDNLHRWVMKCAEVGNVGTCVVALLPAVTGAHWFTLCTHVGFVQGRIPHVGSIMLAHWGDRGDDFDRSVGKQCLVMRGKLPESLSKAVRRVRDKRGYFFYPY